MGNVAFRTRIDSTPQAFSSYLNSSGYTLIEVSWVLTLFVLLLSMLISLQLVLQTQLKLSENKINAIQESQAYFAFVSQEIEKAKRLYTTVDEELYLELSDGTTVKYWLNGKEIARSTRSIGGFRGYTILLYNVTSVSYDVTSDERAVTINITIDTGTHSHSFSTYLSTNLALQP